MKIQKTAVTSDNFPRLANEGITAQIIVSTPRGKHFLFYRRASGLQFVYGGESSHSRPSQKVIQAALSA